MADSFVRLFADDTGKKVQSYENTIGANVVSAQAVVPIDATGWTDSYVQVKPDSTGKNIQAFQNDKGLNHVLAIAVVLVNTAGVPTNG